MHRASRLLVTAAVLLAPACETPTAARASSSSPLERPASRAPARAASPRLLQGRLRDLQMAALTTIQRDAGPAYAIRRGAGALTAHNPAQAFTARFDGRGVSLRGRDRHGPWDLSLRTRAIACAERPGRDGELPANAPRAAGNRVEYAHALAGDPVREWYVNGPQGLEHGYTLARRPACARGVVVQLAASPGWRAALTGDGVALTGPARASVGAPARLGYTALHALDAEGRALPAEMALTPDGRGVELRVDDRGARYPVTIDPLIATLEDELDADDPELGDNLGYAVALDGAAGVAIVGAPFEDELGLTAGAAYVFSESGGAWSLDQKLLASDGVGGDRFGAAVAIDGDAIVIGAYNDDDDGSNSGAAYVFRLVANTWVQVAKLTANDGAAGDEFGISVALDGATALVGAHGDDDKGAGSGSAYVFVDNGGWAQQDKLTAGDGAGGDRFGWDVDVEGDTAIVGAYLDDDDGNGSGSAYVFSRVGNAWSQTQKLVASDGEIGDNFGRAVGVSQGWAAAGAPFENENGSTAGAVYVFDGQNGWAQDSKLLAADGASSDNFGYDLGIDALRIIAGARGDDDFGQSSGAAYVFSRTGNTWIESTKVVANGLVAGDQFAFAVDISGDRLIGGAPDTSDIETNAGAAYVFGLKQTNQGQACAGDDECDNGLCVDAVCCDSACGDGAPDDCQACSVAEGASEDGTCEPLALDTPCRAAAGACDVAEVCDGESDACPADAFAAVDTECRAQSDLCDVAEVCDGQTAACPEDALAPADTECRAAADACDAAELCDGQQETCPEDLPAEDGAPCDGGVCQDGACTPDDGTSSSASGTSGTDSDAGTSTGTSSDSGDPSAGPTDATSGPTSGDGSSSGGSDSGSDSGSASASAGTTSDTGDSSATAGDADTDSDTASAGGMATDDGCGCRGGAPAPGSTFAVLAGALLLLRRRRRDVSRDASRVDPRRRPSRQRDLL